MPIPAPLQPLDALLGRWSGDDELSATQYTPAGRGRSTVDVVRDLDGATVSWRQQLRGDISFDAVGIFGAVGDDIGVWWFDSYGFVPRAVSLTRWHDDGLSIVRTSPRGEAHMRWQRDGDVLRFTVATGPARQPLSSGTYRRA